MAKLPLCFINDVVKLIIFSVAVTPSLLFFIFCILEKLNPCLRVEYVERYFVIVFIIIDRLVI